MNRCEQTRHERGLAATIAGGLPSFSIPAVPLTWETLEITLPHSLILAGVGLIESLLTLSLIDEITETRERGNRECVGQGVANTVDGFFGGMGGCAMIGQSLININSGGRGRLSGISVALFLLAFILFASGLIELIPIAALVGVKFIVVLGTFEWATLRMIGKVPMTDILISILVAAVTVISDLAIAVIVGVIVSALVFATERSFLPSSPLAMPPPTRVISAYGSGNSVASIFAAVGTMRSACLFFIEAAALSPSVVVLGCNYYSDQICDYPARGETRKSFTIAPSKPPPSVSPSQAAPPSEGLARKHA